MIRKEGRQEQTQKAREGERKEGERKKREEGRKKRKKRQKGIYRPNLLPKSILGVSLSLARGLWYPKPPHTWYPNCYLE